ncbi:MAG: hypothetical protein LH702_28270 [Phormidesmis sp. CAN_BIN44]|nr:hypothetical protein [Phormidesmis sp. CAN_BIN44]
MEEQIQSIVSRLQQLPSAKRQSEVENLVEVILKFRRIARKRQGQVLSEIAQEILQEVRCLIREKVEAATLNNQLKFASEKEARQWTLDLLDQAFCIVLDPGRLQAMAIVAQRLAPEDPNESGTPEFRFAITELIESLLIANQLPAQHRVSPHLKPFHPDALSETWAWVRRSIQKFDPERGSFVAWVNFRFYKLLSVGGRAQTDTFTQSSKQRVIRTKYRLSALLKRPNIQFWLCLDLKKLLPEKVLIGTLSFLLIFPLIVSQNSVLADELLFKMAQAELLNPAEVVSIHELEGLENHIRSQSETSPSLLDRVRTYLEEDPDGYCHKSMRSCLEATFQKITLARLDGVSWQELAEQYEAEVSALSNFYQRTLKELAPKIRKYLEE